MKHVQLFYLKTSTETEMSNELNKYSSVACFALYKKSVLNFISMLL